VLIHGDCLEELPNLKDNSIDIILTDPPYFLPINSYVGTREKGYKHRTLADTSILKGYFKQVFTEFDRITKPNGIWYVFCDGQSYPIFYECAFPFAKPTRPLIWDKLVSYNGYTWRHQHEIILWCEREETKRVPTGDGDIIKCRGVRQKERYHPAEKPVELLQKLLEKHKDHKSVLDPYAGSGSVGIACMNTNHEYICIEKDEKYFDIMTKRVNQSINDMRVYL